MRAVIFDQPAVLEGTASVLREPGILARCDLSPGDFFEAVPDGADLYLLKDIIHDWDDVHAALILENVRHAMRPDARLLVIESMIPPGNEPFRGKLVDITMLVLTGGRERTEPESTRLLHSTGLRLNRAIHLKSGASVLEALPI